MVKAGFSADDGDGFDEEGDGGGGFASAISDGAGTPGMAGMTPMTDIGLEGGAAPAGSFTSESVTCTVAVPAPGGAETVLRLMVMTVGEFRLDDAGGWLTGGGGT